MRSFKASLADSFVDGLSYANQTFNLSLPAVETPAHGLTAATSTTTGIGNTSCSAGLRRSQRPTAGRRRHAPPSPSRAAQQSTSTATPVDTTTAAAAGAQPSASSPAHVMKPPKKYHHPVVVAPAVDSSPASGGGRPSAAASTLVAGVSPAAPLTLPTLVKMEVSSDCEEDGNLVVRGGALAAVVDGGYSSSSTLDDTPYASEEEQQCLPVSSDRAVEFDKDDNAACDSLLRDILGQQDGSGDDDEFLSLLSDGDMNMSMMIVNPASEGLSEGFVKREPNNTNVVF